MRTGQIVSLSRDLDPAEPDLLGTGLSTLQRFMGLDEVEHFLGVPLRFEAVTEYVGISAHGSNTHLDGLAHYSWDNLTYNGFPKSDTTSLQGAKSLSMHHAKDGFVTRGVLLDIAALKGVDWLEPGYPITPDDLLEAEERQRVTLESGDALIIHTGHIARRIALGPSSDTYTQAGLHASCLPFLRERDIAVLGSDAINDVQPPNVDDPDMLRPIHTVSLVALGLWLLDNMELTAPHEGVLGSGAVHVLLRGSAVAHGRGHFGGEQPDRDV